VDGSFFIYALTSVNNNPGQQSVGRCSQCVLSLSTAQGVRHGQSGLVHNMMLKFDRENMEAGGDPIDIAITHDALQEKFLCSI
jgi:hypothetical protein